MSSDLQEIFTVNCFLIQTLQNPENSANSKLRETFSKKCNAQVKETGS